MSIHQTTDEHAAKPEHGVDISGVEDELDPIRSTDIDEIIKNQVLVKRSAFGSFMDKAA